MIKNNTQKLSRRTKVTRVLIVKLIALELTIDLLRKNLENNYRVLLYPIPDSAKELDGICIL